MSLKRGRAGLLLPLRLCPVSDWAGVPTARQEAAEGDTLRSATSRSRGGEDLQRQADGFPLRAHEAQQPPRGAVQLRAVVGPHVQLLRVRTVEALALDGRANLVDLGA